MSTKGFRDSIHGFIELHPLLVKVIDTPQFQRLRNIKQLGGNYHVYPGACHNRFEHSIGTCYLAGKLARHLQDEQRKDGMKKGDPLFITDTDILCVELAGLCHDLGHGPFSHVFDGQFMKKIGSSWKHEQGSCDMLDRLIEDYGGLKNVFQGYLNENDITFIKEMINPPSENPETFRGRPNKQFLYEIVSNKKTGVDVDKWDYLTRDCHNLGHKTTFDHNRFISLTKVVMCDDGMYHIAVRDKERRNLYEMFHVRDYLHKSVYQHDVTKAVEQMIADALVSANNCIRFEVERNRRCRNPGRRQPVGPGLKISETVGDMKAFEQLNDSIVDIILFSNDGRHNQAKEVLRRIQRRDLYKPIHHFKYKSKKLCELTEEKFEAVLSERNDEDLQCFIVKKKFDYGSSDADPVKEYWFFTKEEPNIGKKLTDEASYMLPIIFQEFQLVIYNKKSKVGLSEERLRELKEKEEELIEQLREEEEEPVREFNRDRVDNIRDEANQIQ